ncbi:MAG: hypothetical protein CFE26_06225 [Verrucomicrobiales bacterium VVV1]|nr:MAG: hypothetical protein CFE26_06225 [Verrucomicrobiales bacterium VVV1]
MLALIAGNPELLFVASIVELAPRTMVPAAVRSLPLPAKYRDPPLMVKARLRVPTPEFSVSLPPVLMVIGPVPVPPLESDAAAEVVTIPELMTRPPV